MADPHRIITEFLSGTREAQTRFLAELVKVPSDNPPGDCLAHAERAAALLQDLGFEVERHAVPEAQVKALGMVRATNLIVRRRFGDGPVIALNAHGDVVPPGEGWTHDPYGAEIVDGWMYGRGVAVSKSDFATYAYALLALDKAAAAGARLAGTVELHLTYDEEVGGEIGPKWLIEEGISSPDLALGAGFSYAVVNAHNGCLHLEVRVDGRSAHAAMPFTGVDALQAATHILSALYEWRKSLAKRTSDIPGIGSPQLTIGLIKGGINTNVVPDRVIFRLDRRMIPEENPDQVEAELRTLIAEAADANPEAAVSVRRILLAEPLLPLDGGRQLTELLCAHASRIMGEPVTAKGVPLYTDARHYAAAGIPVVLYGAGPHTIQEANAHRADERLPLDDLYKATQVVALALCDLLTKA
jgi:acetylornithine deacetylase/succinyl-diaminopimelate desuccinylase family protein